MEYRKKERVTALAVLAGALLVLIYVIPNHIDLDQEFELAILSPAFFPKLATCMRSHIGFPVIVVNDNAYGAVGYFQRRFYQREYETRLTNPDFISLAHAFGAQATRVDSPAGLGEALDKAIGSEELWMIELVATFPEYPAGRY